MKSNLERCVVCDQRFTTNHHCPPKFEREQAAARRRRLRERRAAPGGRTFGTRLWQGFAMLRSGGDWSSY